MRWPDAPGAELDDARSDVQLLAAVREGDRGALHELFLRHEAWVAARVRRRCADPDVGGVAAACCCAVPTSTCVP